MRFDRANLLDLGNLDEEFDITWFSGLLYHLPDPVAGLKLAADRTRDLLYLNTAIMGSEPGDVEKPSLVMKMEGTKQLMSGVNGLSWLPSGPQVLCEILKWLGFPETRTLMWIRKWTQTHNLRAPVTGRIVIVAARESGRLSGVEDVKPVVQAAQIYR